MKIIFTILLLWMCGYCFAQQKSEFDSSGILPHFTFFTMDGNPFTSDSIDANKKTVLVYFKTECGYCEEEIDSILFHIHSFKNVQVLLLSHQPLNDIKAFVEKHHIDQYPQVKMIHDKDLSYYLYYHTRLTPTIHIYYQNRLLFFADGQATVDEIEKYLQ